MGISSFEQTIEQCSRPRYQELRAWFAARFPTTTLYDISPTPEQIEEIGAQREAAFKALGEQYGFGEAIKGQIATSRTPQVVQWHLAHDANKRYFETDQHRDILDKIVMGNERLVFQASLMAHVSSFLVPSIINITRAISKGRRYTEETVVSNLTNTSNALAVAFLQHSTVGGFQQRDPAGVTEDIRRFHHQNEYKGNPAVPDLDMAYQMFEFIRATVFLSEQQGNVIPFIAKQQYYRVMKEIVQRGRFRMPDSYVTMRSVAHKVDASLASHPIVTEVQQLLVRVNNTAKEYKTNALRYGIDYESMIAFLRPHRKSEGIFQSLFPDEQTFLSENKPFDD